MMGIIGVWPPTSTSSLNSLNPQETDSISSTLMPPIEWPDPEMLRLESHVRNCLPSPSRVSHGNQNAEILIKTYAKV